MDAAKNKGQPSHLISGPIERTLLMFSLPTLGSNILQSINGSINAIWVGQLLGPKGLAATINANLIMFMMISLVFGFGMACTILVAQSIGRNDIEGMRRAVGAGCGLFIIMGILVGVLGWIFAPALLHLLDTPADIFPKSLLYMRVVFIGLPTALLTVFLSMALRGTGDAMTPLFLLIPSTLINTILNPILILGLGPMPKLGIAGAGVATLVANLISFVLGLTIIYWRDLPVRLRQAEFKYLIPAKDVAIRIMRMGVPMGLQMVVMSVSSLIMLGLVNGHGSNTVAAYGAVNQLWTYIQMPAFAIGTAVSSMAAQNIGAGLWNRVGLIARTGVVMNIVVTGVLVLAIILFENVLIGLFLDGDPQSSAIARHINLMASWSFILAGITMVVVSVVRANGATLVPLLIMVVAYVPGRLGFAYGLQPHLGADAIWWSFPLGAAVSLLLSLGYYSLGSWRNLSPLATAGKPGA